MRLYNKITFYDSSSYYYNNPERYATDIYNMLKDTGLENYIDFDIEHIDNMFNETADFIGNVCKKYKSLNPNSIIGHAPQPPYFTQQYGNVYKLIYQKYKDYFDYFFIQYYNNGPSNTFDEIFIKSDTSVAPNTSVLELINSGIDSSYLVVGKTINGESNSDNGYVNLPNKMTSIIKQAFDTPSLSSWKKNGGEGVWYYNSQNNSDINNNDLITYFTNISKF
jgi:chitinase